METRVTLKYDGGFAADGEMDAYAASAAIRAFTDFTKALAEGVYGRGALQQMRVRPPKHGSHEIEFFAKVVEVGGIVAATMNVSTPEDLLQLAKDTFTLIKHLKGEPPKEVVRADNGSVSVVNNNGTVINVNGGVVNIINDPRVTRAASGFVKKPLEDSATKLSILSDDKVVDTVDVEESRSFVPISFAPVILTRTDDLYLTVVTAQLEATTTKWGFSDGRNNFVAEIEDEVFLERVKSGIERFGNGDVLFVRMRSTQRKLKGKLVADYVVEEVLDHQAMDAIVQGEIDGGKWE